MSEISIAKIKLNNPILAVYIKKIQSWENADNICKHILENNNENSGFYGIFYNEKFLGASTLDYNKENACVDISIVNGSNCHYEEIQKASIEQLTNLAQNQYGKKIINFR